MPLTVPCVPTGMNIGVLAVKCGKVIRATRARLNVASTSKCNGLVPSDATVTDIPQGCFAARNMQCGRPDQ